MSATPTLEQFSPIAEAIAKAAYGILQDSKGGFSLTHKTLASRLSDLFVPERQKNIQTLPPEILRQLQERRQQLLEADWQDGQAGVYPLSLLFDGPWEDFWRYYPTIWLDMPKIWELIRNRQYQSFSPDIEIESYPSYYLQNFHYQSDGYLSDLSANLYDLQVEILFNGTADAMRRRILKPLKQRLTAFDPIAPRQVRLLDVACGTGRTLKLLRGTFPKASLFGTDLSPAYLRKASELLGQMPGELPQLVQANSEELPYLDGYFHGITSVFLFHELPPAARQQVIAECFRTLKPGGTFIICDSIQVLDSPEFAPMMQNFSAMFHEPYYQHYIRDDLGQRLEKAGFEDIKTENHLVSKYWFARKPFPSA